jgi:hypothetical protein
MKLPIDADATEDWTPFRFGKAFHKIHEDSMHELGYFEDKADEYVDKAMKEFNLDGHEHECHLYSAVLSSLMLWKKTRLIVKACEQEIGDDNTVGYVDFVAVDPNTDHWYIGDLKTTSMMTNISSRLIRDPQLSLYWFFRKQLAEKLGLDVTKFRGCLYRETIKPKLARASGTEKPSSYAKRAIAESQIYIIPADKMSEDPVSVHAMIHGRMMDLHKGKPPIRNYKNCLAYNRKCEFWSRCYGMLGCEADALMRDNTMFLVRKTGKGHEIPYTINAFSLSTDIVEPAKELTFDDLF